MLQANFIAERSRRHRVAMRWALACCRLLPLCGLVLLGLPLTADLLASHSAASLLAMRQARRTISGQAATAGRIQDALAHFDTTHRMAIGVRAADAQWLDLLQEIRDRLPQNLWLTRLQVLPEAAGDDHIVRQRLLLTGRAGDGKAAGELLEALNRSPWFQGAVLRRASPPEQGAGPTEFEMEAVLRRPIPTAANGGATS